MVALAMGTTRAPNGRGAGPQFVAKSNIYHPISQWHGRISRSQFIDIFEASSGVLWLVNTPVVAHIVRTILCSSSSLFMSNPLLFEEERRASYKYIYYIHMFTYSGVHVTAHQAAAFTSCVVFFFSFLLLKTKSECGVMYVVNKM